MARTGELMFTGRLGVIDDSGAGWPEVEGGVQVATTLDSQPDEVGAAPAAVGTAARRVPAPAARFRATPITDSAGLRSLPTRPSGVVEPATHRSGWLRRYRRGLVAIDLVTAAAALLISFLVRFGPAESGSRF